MSAGLVREYLGYLVIGVRSPRRGNTGFPDARALVGFFRSVTAVREFSFSDGTMVSGLKVSCFVPKPMLHGRTEVG